MDDGVLHLETIGERKGGSTLDELVSDVDGRGRDGVERLQGLLGELVLFSLEGLDDVGDGGLTREAAIDEGEIGRDDACPTIDILRRGILEDFQGLIIVVVRIVRSALQRLDYGRQARAVDEVCSD